MFKINQKVKVPVTDRGSPCWDLSMFSGDAASTVVGTVIQIDNGEVKISYPKGSKNEVWWFYLPDSIPDLFMHPGTYPSPLNEDVDVILRIPFQYGHPTTDQIKKASDDAASYVRRNYRSWPFGMKLSYLMSQDKDGQTVADFFFEGIDE